MRGTVLGTQNKAVTIKDEEPCPSEAGGLIGQTINHTTSLILMLIRTNFLGPYVSDPVWRVFYMLIYLKGKAKVLETLISKA